MMIMQARIKEVMDLAQRRWGVDLSGVQVRLDLRGRCAGQAGYRGIGLGRRAYFMRFNRDMILGDGFDHLIKDTIPHEVAHLVTFMRPELGRNHDAGWKRVCRALGGSGERCHNQQVVYAKGRTFQYRTTTGQLTTVSERIHRKIQMGVVYRLKRGGGRLDKSCDWSLLGLVKLAEAPTNTNTSTSTTPPAGMSKAQRVRQIIHAARAGGQAQAAVISTVIAQLGMARSQARKYVEENWLRA